MPVRQQTRSQHGAASFGEILRREREARGISLREISHATKISMSHLASLEDSNLDALSGGAFTRGFVRAYATQVGLDGEEMVNRYLFAIAGPSEAAPVPARSPRQARRRLLVLILAAMVAAVAVGALLWWIRGG